MRYKARRDVNENQIVNYLRRLGASVYQIDQKGFPDLAVGFGGINLLLEVKSESGKLTSFQEDFFSSWQGLAFVVRNIKEVKEILRMPVTRVYSCPDCGVFVLRESIKDEPKKVCPVCEKKIQQQYNSVTTLFMGTGWGSDIGKS